MKSKSNPIVLSQPVQYIKGVGPKRAELLAKLNIHTVEDLLHHLPREYQDRSRIQTIRDLQPMEIATIKGKIHNIQEKRLFRTRGPVRHILKVTIIDETGFIHAVWFNQPYRAKEFEIGQEILLTGKTRFSAGKLEIDPIDFEIIKKVDREVEGESTIPMGIVPIYPLTEGLNQKFFRKIIRNVLDEIKEPFPDFLPEELNRNYDFPNRDNAIRKIHFPDDSTNIEKVRDRFIYEELFGIQFFTALQKRKQEKTTKIQKYKKESEWVNIFLKRLPFQLTPAQINVNNEIMGDLLKLSPMNRLLQGDVGSGKTVVAIMAVIRVVESGYQTAVMVPTEVLAEQHYRTFQRWLSPLNINVRLLTGSQRAKERKEIQAGMENGDIQVIIGTHALIQEKIRFKNLSLIIIDEQHRFGVIQRDTLRKKAFQPDILVMSATPIPRTLIMTVYGDLDVSVIDEMPPGRTNIITRWYSEKQRDQIYFFIGEQVKMGRQVYLIYPLVEESNKIELRAAVQMFEHLRNDIFPTYKMDIIHGRMNRKEQQELMELFSSGKIDILVSTTVIEVGIDVPNATVMVIEHADRFGLSQIHQLRGRVGRGIYPSHCILVTSDSIGDLVKERLTILTQIVDGFKIAEHDLRLRGAGDPLGTLQHGINILRISDLIRDHDWLIKARTDALAFIRKEGIMDSMEYKRVFNHYQRKMSDNQNYAIVA